MLEFLKDVKNALPVLARKPDPDNFAAVPPEIVKIAKPILRAFERYFRAEVIGLEKIPAGKALVVSNHNSGITFFEPFFLGLEWVLMTEGKDPLRFLAHDIIMALPGLGRLVAHCGSVNAGHGAAEKAFAAGQKVAVWPGGNFEAFRPYSQRHKVDFGGKKGWLKLALRSQVPIVPVMAIGSHESFFILWRGESLARVTGVKRLLRSESFPVFIGLPFGIGLGPLFHIPLPAKMLIEVGDPIELGHGPEAADDPAVLQELYDKVTGRLQEMMDRRAAERRWPIIG